MPSFLIKTLKVKWTMVLSVITYSIYIAAQFYPEFYTLIPTAILLGMGAAPLWAAKCTYLTQVFSIISRFTNLGNSAGLLSVDAAKVSQSPGVVKPASPNIGSRRYSCHLQSFALDSI